MTPDPDRLYQLLPVIYRQRDAEQGYPLRALLQVISEQVNLVEADIAQLYDNWFIETCQDWVVPYIGDLLGYRLGNQAGVPDDSASVRAQLRSRITNPRRDVAHTVRDRRRKGTLAVIDALAQDVAGWPARATEFYRMLAVTQSINHLRLQRGRTIDLRDGSALERLDGPFDASAHTVDLRRMGSRHGVGRFNIPDVGITLWRLKSYSVTAAPAACFEEVGPYCFHFSALGNDAQLFTPAPTQQSTPSSGELDFPQPIRRRAFARSLLHKTYDFTGPGKSFQIWIGSPPQAVPPEQLVAADLTDWRYRPLPGQVAVDPVLGRIVFPPNQVRRQGVSVSYHTGFSADIGGGEYERTLAQPAHHQLYLVGEGQAFTTITDAVKQWQSEQPVNAVIELTDSGVYVEPINFVLKDKQTLQLRAANHKRPVIRIVDWQTCLPDSLSVSGGKGSWFTLDGVMVTGRPVQISGEIAGVTLRHVTLVPGWGLDCDCERHRPTEPSLELINAPDCITIEHSILGSIQVNRDGVRLDSTRFHISDSIVDAGDLEQIAIGAPEALCADAVLTIVRSTVFGRVQTQAIELAENCIFMSSVLACRRQFGCVRFCYVPLGSRTPRRYQCQPDGVLQAVDDLFKQSAGSMPAAERDALRLRERTRVVPDFNSVRYGTPTYCQLSFACADEITRGADDESEIGVFHDLYQPQRVANLLARLDEYTPAGMDAGVLFAS
ncbi:MAG: hypothetical protein M3N23_10325 [Pseudomonadota bacterium]|nr:hypothetical protein [Pseudomonadota bacterium]